MAPPYASGAEPSEVYPTMLLTSFEGYPPFAFIHGLKARGFLRRRVTRVISFNRPEGIELKLFIGHRVIGWLLPGKKERHIRRPFRVFVDEGFLSRAESIHTMSPEKEE